MELIDWKYFEKIEIRVGTIIQAEEFPEARKPAYKLSVDFGEQGIKKSSAQITDLYKPDDLIGKQVIAVINFQAKQVGSFFSECLVTGFYNHNKQVVLAVPDQKVENGSRLL
jgi:tRNA-binding protein